MIAADQVQRYIRLTELITPLLDMVDEKQIALRPAVELSYLPKDQQELLLQVIERDEGFSFYQASQRAALLQQGRSLKRGHDDRHSQPGKTAGA